MIVQFRSSFAKDLRGIEDQSLLRRIQEIIEKMEQTQSLRELPNIKKLRGGANYYRIRVGDYRIGLIAEGDRATLVRCLGRKELYRYFP